MSFIVNVAQPPRVIAGDSRNLVQLARVNTQNNIERVKEKRPVLNLVKKTPLVKTSIKGLNNTGYDNRNLILHARRKVQQQRFLDNDNLQQDNRNFSKIYFQ